MDADHDRSSDDAPSQDGSPQDALVALPEEVPPGAPLRFLLREFHEDLGPTLYLWGVQVPGGAIGFSPEGKPIIEAESAENIRRLFGRVKALDLIWIDPPDRS